MEEWTHSNNKREHTTGECRKLFKNRVTPYGEMAEWSKADALKAFEAKASVGSNPTLSASSKTI